MLTLALLFFPFYHYAIKHKFIPSKTFLYLAFFGTQKTKMTVGFFSHSFKFYDAMFSDNYNGIKSSKNSFSAVKMILLSEHKI